MAAKETVGKSKLCIVLAILDRISQSFFLFLEVTDAEFANKKPLLFCQKTITYITII